MRQSGHSTFRLDLVANVSLPQFLPLVLFVALDIIVQFATGRTLENDAVVTSMLDYCAKDLERRIPLALRYVH